MYVVYIASNNPSNQQADFIRQQLQEKFKGFWAVCISFEQNTSISYVEPWYLTLSFNGVIYTVAMVAGSREEEVTFNPEVEIMEDKVAKPEK